MNRYFKLANNLKKYRLISGMTQTDLARTVGCSKNTISSIETGQFSPTAYLACNLCLVLNCKFEDLFFLELTEGVVHNETVV